MSTITQIDRKCRTGALRGIFNPKETYAVEKMDNEIHFRLLVPAQSGQPKLIKRNGLTLLSRGTVLTQVEVNRSLEQFP